MTSGGRTTEAIVRTITRGVLDDIRALLSLPCLLVSVMFAPKVHKGNHGKAACCVEQHRHCFPAQGTQARGGLLWIGEAVAMKSDPWPLRATVKNVAEPICVVQFVSVS